MRSVPLPRSVVRLTAGAASALLTVAGLGAAAVPSVAVALPAPVPASAHAPHVFTHRTATPPTTADCEAAIQIACYSPKQYQEAYEVDNLLKNHIDGRGKTIAIVDAFGSPTIQQDLDAFDKAFGLPAGHVQVITPAGKPPAFDPNNADHVGWAFETTLDVEYAHAMAPGAKILLVETPVAETEGVTGFPEIVKAENYVIRHHLADVISQSFGATENTFANPKRDIAGLRSAFKEAAEHHVTVLAASGDDGATNPTNGDGTYPYRVNSWPSSDPLVTSIGGTQLHLDAKGHRLSPDVVWNDGYGAAGGGVSQVFSRPRYQNRVAGVVGSHRGTPDISMTAAVDGGALVYLSFPGLDAGFYIVGGTSEATPIFAGIVAAADQVAHHDVGFINPALYALHGSRHAGIVDVTSGNNSFAGVTGYSAKAGYDLASGWGTIDAPDFVRALARR